VLIATSVAFDLTQKNLFAALASGARVVLRSEGNFDPSEIRALIEDQQISILNCTPSLFYPLIERPDDARYAQLRSLRHVVLGGEPIDLKKIRPWLQHRSCHARLMNSYGPTECTDVCAACDVLVPGADDASWAAELTVPIGRPISNVTLSVLDAARKLVPMGAAGELYIAGVGLGLGYLGRPADAQHGFVQLDAGPAYRTGDLVRHRWDGQLEFLGRVDNQVKVRGYRINLEEVEAALRKHARIADAAVTTSRTGESVGALNAYYVADEELDASELRYWLSDVLPRYMVPSSFTRLSSMPLTRSGKVDRMLLPEPRGVVRRPPRGDLELTLHALWQELLGISELGVEDDFFSVGGHSLMAIRLAEEVELKLRRPCRVADVFERPTIQELAELLSRRAQESLAEQRSAG
jgi:acyl-coenzyme A synthetase/AMP-(fatty) acid ligase